MEILKFNPYTKFKSWFVVGSPVFTTRISLLISIIIAVAGITIGILENSLAVKTNGIVAALDILNSALFLHAVNMSVRNPDYIFNYGYGKYESISILASAISLIFVLGYTSFEAISNFGVSEPEDSNYLTLILFSFLSFVLMRIVWRIQLYSAKKYKMPILKYDADLWKTDSIIELVVLSNLVLGLILQSFELRYYGLMLDSGIAVSLIIFALIVPLKGSRDALNQLLDRTVSEDIQLNVLGSVTENLKHFCEYKSLHTRQSGKDIFIEIDIVLPYDSTIEYKDFVEKEICNNIKKKFPTSVPRVYAVSCDRSCINNGQKNCPMEKIRELNE